MKRTDFEKICRQIVIDFPIIGNGKLNNGRLNSFLLSESDEQMKQKNFGVTYESYLHNNFYSRFWVNQGAKKESMSIDYAVLICEHDVSKFPIFETKNTTHKYNFVILDQQNCATCKKTIGEITSDLERSAKMFIEELLRYNLYEYTDNQNNLVRLWSVENRKQNNWKKISSIKPFLFDEEIELYDFSDNDLKEFVGKVFSITIKDCEKENIVFNYANVADEIKCDVC